MEGATETVTPGGALIWILYVPGDPTFLTLRVTVMESFRLVTVIEG